MKPMLTLAAAMQVVEIGSTEEVVVGARFSQFRWEEKTTWYLWLGQRWLL